MKIIPVVISILQTTYQLIDNVNRYYQNIA